MSSNVDRIKERLGIIDVVGSYIKLEKSGSNFKAKCPFHNERTPSFFISPDRGTYYCFGCGAKGDIFNFIQEFEGLDFLGSLRSLASRAGVALEIEDRKSGKDKEKLFDLLEFATSFFEDKLAKNNDARSYLKKRGLAEKTIKDWRIGYSEDKWRSLFDAALERGFKEEELEKTGLVKKSEESKGRFYDVFRGRVIFPIFDSAGRVVAFSGRLILEKENAPKYLNSPETVLFNKSDILYGFDRAKLSIREKNYSILVEGQIDLVLSHQAGFNNTVATSGTSLTLKHLERLNRLSSRIIFAFDGDSAGFKAAEKSFRLSLSLGMNARVAPIPSGEDPASVILKNKDSWQEILKQSKHIIDFNLDKIISSNFEKRRVDFEVKKRILPLIKILPSGIDRARFISEVSEKMSIKESAIWEDLKSLPESDIEIETEVLENKSSTINRKSNIISKIAGIVFWQESLGGGKIMEPADIREKIEDLEGLTIDSFSDEKDELVFEAEAYFSGRDDLEKIINDLILNLEEEILKEKFSESMKALSEAEKEGNKERSSELLLACREIGNKINDIKIKKSQKTT